MDGMIPLSIDQSSSIDIHNLMNQIYVSFPIISYGCFLFDDHFVLLVLFNGYFIYRFGLISAMKTKSFAVSSILVIKVESFSFSS